MKDETWKCNICGRERPDNFISVRRVDISEELAMPPETMQQTIRYCNDNEDCIEKSKTHKLFGM